MWNFVREAGFNGKSQKRGVKEGAVASGSTVLRRLALKRKVAGEAADAGVLTTDAVAAVLEQLAMPGQFPPYVADKAPLPPPRVPMQQVRARVGVRMWLRVDHAPLCLVCLG